MEEHDEAGGDGIGKLPFYIASEEVTTPSAPYTMNECKYQPHHTALVPSCVRKTQGMRCVRRMTQNLRSAQQGMMLMLMRWR